MTNSFTLICNVVATIIIGFAWILYFKSVDLNKKYPDPKNLPRTNGIIHHPTLGDYPEKVKFHQGMDLLPGQEASVEIEVEKKEGK